MQTQPKADNDKLMAQIRQGLTQYCGSMLTHTGYSGAPARQIVASILVEEAMKLASDSGDDSVTDIDEIYVAKPVLRATIIILQKRVAELIKLATSSVDDELQQKLYPQISNYNKTVKVIQNLIDSVGERKVDTDGAGDQSCKEV